MKIYTRTGDEGDTALFGGGRVDKDHPRVEAYGDVDELNASLGLARSIEMMPRIDEVLVPVQRDLFALGALLATPDHETENDAELAVLINRSHEIVPFTLPGDDWQAMGTDFGNQAFLPARSVVFYLRG